MSALEITTLCINALWLTWLLCWVVFAFTTKRTVYRQPWRQRLAYLSIGIVFVLVTQMIPHTRDWLLGPHIPLQAAGVALCAAGLAFAAWARMTLGRNWSGLVTLKENHQLVQSGPYRLVRHPIYTGILTAITGTALAVMPSCAGIGLVLALTLAFLIKLRQEEHLMRQQFPEAYPAYKSRVRAALIPFIF